MKIFPSREISLKKEMKEQFQIVVALSQTALSNPITRIYFFNLIYKHQALFYSPPFYYLFCIIFICVCVFYFILFFFMYISSHVFFIISFFTAWPLRLVQGRNVTKNSRRQQNGRRDVQGIHSGTSAPLWLSPLLISRNSPLSSRGLLHRRHIFSVLESLLQSFSFHPRRINLSLSLD